MMTLITAIFTLLCMKEEEKDERAKLGAVPG